MRNTVLYIAISLDGYIADMKGSVDWLAGDGSQADAEGSYFQFLKKIDTVVLGYSTYHQITTELSPDKWAYEGMKSYVLTHRTQQSTEEIIFTDENIETLMTTLKSVEGKDIWICGGANIVNQFIDQNLIDRYHISVIPVILGNGIPLFQKQNKDIKLKLISTESYNGITDLVYERR
jgi:dihydrofolate reductase